MCFVGPQVGAHMRCVLGTIWFIGAKAGATGDVMFDANGGRLGVYVLDNALQNGTLLETRAMWRASESKWAPTLAMLHQRLPEASLIGSTPNGSPARTRHA